MFYITFKHHLKDFLNKKKNKKLFVFRIYIIKIKEKSESMNSFISWIGGKKLLRNRSYEKIIEKYDTASTLFYLYPPYHNTEYLYNTDFDEQQHLQLHGQLNNLKGRFVLSYNDDDFIRNLYKNLNILEVERNHNFTCRYNKNRRFKELIIKNY